MQLVLRCHWSHNTSLAKIMWADLPTIYIHLFYHAKLTLCIKFETIPFTVCVLKEIITSLCNRFLLNGAHSMLNIFLHLTTVQAPLFTKQKLNIEFSSKFQRNSTHSNFEVIICWIVLHQNSNKFKTSLLCALSR